jgi:hypothetical protein
MDGLDGEIVVTIHRVLNQVNLIVEIFLRAGEFLRSQEVLASRLTNHETRRADRLNIKVKGYSMLRRAARLFLRNVSTLPKCVCLACPGKNLRHANTESRIK